MTYSNRRIAVSSVALSVALAASGIAQAQDAPADEAAFGDEIVVTAAAGNKGSE